MTTDEKQKKLEGLSTSEAERLLAIHGKNELTPEKKENIILKLLKVLKEPMFLLLIIAATVYFILGEPRDGAIMLIFVVGIISIETIQEWKTDRTLQALKDLSAPKIKVRRDGVEQIISSSLLVPGDIMYINEGVKIPADSLVMKASTLCVDESSLTGESLGVFKNTEENLQDEGNDYWRKDYCYAGTLVTQGTGTILVEKTGATTEYGKIGKELAEAENEDTPLQRQTGTLVKFSGLIAAVLFIIVGITTYFNIPDHTFKSRIIESILSGITLAMAMIPEEFPVILTVFLSMGAWRLARKQSLVRRLPAVETLGAVSVLCVDKTGTITMNKMAVRETYSTTGDEIHITRIMGLGCKPDAYDPMEKAMLERCEELGMDRQELFSGRLLKEYAFTDELKMMGHVWEKDGRIIVAAKGSPEKILKLCNLDDEKLKVAEEKIYEMSVQGLRVIGVGQMNIADEASIPSTLEECRLEFLGIVGLADPPREEVKENIRTCTKAGVRVVMITGDNGVTASSIARQIGMPDSDKIITGDQLEKMDENQLRVKVREVSIFSRVLPEHKMRIVKAFKENGAVVAMTGDGVNDAPALKYADIGIAMGKRGSEVSREAADLILLDDNFSTIVDTIRDGRRIYDNIKKAVGYVFTIHIPIAFASLLGPMLGISPVSLLLLPLHVVLLELVIDPTCSIVLERQPGESDIMDRPPRNPKERLLSFSMLSKSVIQGLCVFGASFGAYSWFLETYPENAPLARTMGLAIIFLSNILLVQVNSSNRELAYRTFKRQIKDVVMWISIIGTLAGLLVMLYTPLSGFLKLAPLSLGQFFAALGISGAAVLWYELVKGVRLLRKKNRSGGDRMNKPRKLLTQKEMPAIGELSALAMKEDKTVLADWSISCCEEYILPIWNRYHPEDDRPKEALLAARRWLNGEIKLPEAKVFILRCHEAAREAAGNPGALAAARAIGQCASTIHSKRHALGLLHYGLTSMAFDSLGAEAEWAGIIKYANKKIINLTDELFSKIEEYRKREPVLVLERYIRACRSQLEKSRTGSSKHSLLRNRIDALMLARSLFLNEVIGEGTDIKKSLGAVDSIIAKSEKAILGQREDGETWKRLERLIRVMKLSRKKIEEYEK